MNRIAALCLVFGAVILTCYAIAFLALMPLDLAATKFAALVNRPMWTPLACLAMLGLLLLTHGLMQVLRALPLAPSHLAVASGLVAIACILNVANLTWEAFVFPAIAKSAASAFVLNDGQIRDDGAVQMFHLLRVLASASALVALLHALWRRKDVPTRWGGVLLALGLGAFTFEAMLPPAIIVLGMAGLCGGALILARGK